MATATSSTGRESDKFMLRFPDGMRASIKEAADKNKRTMNAEIVARLQSTFRSAEPKHTFDLVEDTAIAGDEVLAPELMELVREAAITAARQVLAETQSLQPGYLGGGSVVLGLPVESARKPTKKTVR